MPRGDKVLTHHELENGKQEQEPGRWSTGGKREVTIVELHRGKQQGMSNTVQPVM